MTSSTSCRAALAVSSCLLAVASSAVTSVSAQGPAPRPCSPSIGPTFVENRGQWDARARYLARAGGLDTWLTDRGFVVGAAVPSAGSAESADGAVRGVALYLTFEGANPGSRPSAVDVDRRQGLRNYLLGDDPSRWVQGVRSYGRVRYPSMYEGIDLVVRQQDGVVEYDLDCDPWAELERVVIRCEGHDALRVDQDGTLVVSTAIGELRQKAPATWTYDANGARCAVACRYRVLGPDRFGFAVDGWPRDRALTIDPGLVWSTYLGGTGFELLRAIALTSAGDVVVAGDTQSARFPTTPGAFQRSPGDTHDAFVTRLSADGSGLVFSTYFGGDDIDEVRSIQVTTGDSVYLAGETRSSDFPITPDAFGVQSGSSMAFASQLDATGSSLAYSTLFGGSAQNRATGIHVDESRGRIYLFGEADSQVPTTPNAFQPTAGGSRDAFVAVLERRAQPPSTALHYGTHLGGSLTDFATGGLHVEPGGAVAISGRTNSSDFPTSNGAFQSTRSGTSDVFVCLLDPSRSGASGLVYGTYVGGSMAQDTVGIGMHRGRLVFAGFTSSTDWPVTPDAVQSVHRGFFDGVVTILDPGLSGTAGLAYSTYLGSSVSDVLWAMDLSNEMLTVLGNADANGLPTTTGAFQETGAGCYLAQLDLTGGGTPQLAYATYFGRARRILQRQRAGVVREAGGRVTFGASVGADRIPVTPGAFQTAHAGNLDAFVARLDPRPLPPGSITFGVACPCSAGTPVLAPPRSVHIGQPFDLEITGLTPAGTGVVNLGVSRTQWRGIALPFSLTPLGARGCTIYVSGEVEMPLNVSAGRAGFSFTVPNELNLVGTRFFTQFVLVDPLANSLGVALSNASESEVRF